MPTFVLIKNKKQVLSTKMLMPCCCHPNRPYHHLIAVFIVILFCCFFCYIFLLVIESRIQQPRQKSKLTAIDQVSSKRSANLNWGRPIVNFIYNPPPKTGSLVTRDEMRRFCTDFGLNCLTQTNPCAHSLTDCFIENAKVKEQLKRIFWSAFTERRLAVCCPRALNQTFQASLFHVFEGDSETGAFFERHFPPNTFRLSILRDPVDQFISFYRYITVAHRPIYERYLRLAARPLPLAQIVDKFYSHVRGFERLSPDELMLYENIHNVQSRVLGWDNTQKGLDKVIEKLQYFHFVGITKELSNCWSLLRSMLFWPRGYLDSANLRPPTVYNISSDLRMKIQTIQYADMKLYTVAEKLYKDIKESVSLDSKY